MNSQRVLLVEDDERVREVFAAYLDVDGWTVIEAADGLEALEAALADPPDLVVTDIMMPRLDGVALIRRLRAEPDTRDIPILVVSAHATPVVELEEYPDRLAYLSKPVSLGTFLTAVKRLLAAAREAA